LDKVLPHEFLEGSARKYSNKIALVQKEERWTYREIEERANQVAHLPRNQGIQRGDRVAIFLDNSVEPVTFLLGILKGDAVFLMLSSLLKPPKLGYILNNCRAKMMISEAGKLNTASEVFPSIPSLEPVVSVGRKTPTSSAAHSKVIPWREIGTLSMCGLTECKTVPYLSAGELDRRADSVGRGIPNEAVGIAEEQATRKAGNPNGKEF
jgi:acyl-CoA synthetase (AMP-forming)/AMP-acid ligase II